MSGSSRLRRGWNHLGSLNAIVRDLQGYGTLAHELIQNADDAKATHMSFRIDRAALVVDNDAVFSDCGHVEDPLCSWNRADGGHNCDFHRLQDIAGGDKRRQADTIGAFGIGFSVVYQVTDHPEIISGGRHWRFDEAEREDRRIEVCHGCDECRSIGDIGTRFVLPWARDPESVLRRALDAEAIVEASVGALEQELAGCLGRAMLFLNSVREIRLLGHNSAERRWQLKRNESDAALHDNHAEVHRWFVRAYDFTDQASQLRLAHQQIELKRRALVAVAIPIDEAHGGILYTGLPTETRDNLPICVNADFYTSTDRKRVLLDGRDYQSEWNRAALRASARAFGSVVAELPARLGSRQFWDVVKQVRALADLAAHGTTEPAFGAFWDELAPKLKTLNAVESARGVVLAPNAVCLREHQDDEQHAVALLNALGIDTVHADLRPYFAILRSGDVGVRLEDVAIVCDALREHGLDQRTPYDDLPVGLKKAGDRQTLWAELSRLRARKMTAGPSESAATQELQSVAIAPTRSGALAPPTDVYAADHATVSLFEAIDVDCEFFDDGQRFGELESLCRRFSAVDGIQLLEALSPKTVEDRWRAHKFDIRDLFQWLEARRASLDHDEQLRRRLAALPIFPAGRGLSPAAGLSLPGSFEDPLGLAALVDVAATGGRHEFLLSLGIPILDVCVYARKAAAALAVDKDHAKRVKLVDLLAAHIGRLRDDVEARQALADADIVACLDGAFRRAKECYFANPVVDACLGSETPQVDVAVGREAIRDFYAWLGVADRPRLADLVARLESGAEEPYSKDERGRRLHIFNHVAARVDDDDARDTLSPLKSVPWLPARNRIDRWYRPSELWTAFRDYLFDTQATFIDVPILQQRDAAKFLDIIGVQSQPAVKQVVDHVLACSAGGLPVHVEVYRFLTEHLDDPHVSRLRGAKCLWIGGQYVACTSVFWNEHQFGSYRSRLSDELRPFTKLLEKLGTRPSPTVADAKAVLLEIVARFGDPNLPLDDEALAVIAACWRELEQGLRTGEIADVSDVAGTKCIPRGDRILQPPSWMYFDNRPDLARKFDAVLSYNLIARPVGAAVAYARAGVRNLSESVRIELLESREMERDELVHERLVGRRGLLVRVVQQRAEGVAPIDILRRLEMIECMLCTGLEVRYQLDLFGKAKYSAPERPTCVFDPEASRLVRDGDTEQLPWPTIARELASALLPAEDVGQLAAGLVSALTPASRREATSLLDELGFPNVDSTIISVPAAAAETTLGTEEFRESQAFGEHSPDPTNRDDSASAVSPAGPSPGGQRNPAPMYPAAENESPGDPRGESNRRGAGSESRYVLRTYVQPPDSTEPPSNSAAPKKRRPVAAAGVRRAMEYEQANGRFPQEMAHPNPGYDIESRDEGGSVVRLIEVKSFSGPWRSNYAVLSREQFRLGYDGRAPVWLYVVENAQGENARLYVIPNPARVVNHFMFDDGWAVLADDTDRGEIRA